jgi:hypothetical protein
MSNELYFIPIITKALGQKDTQQSLTQAFEQIKSLGANPDYENGYGQFQRFMDSVNQHTKKKPGIQLKSALAKELIVELATDTFEGSSEDKEKALNIIKSNPQWQKEYDKLIAEIEELSRIPEDIEILLSRNNKPFKSIKFADIPGSKTIDKIAAGLYKISFASGQIIWEGRLTEQNLIWTMAYPGKPFDMAADTTGQGPQSVKQIDLFEGKIIIQIYPGIEAGSMKITMTKAEDTE